MRLEGRLGKSDHEMISFQVWVDAKRTRDQQCRRNFRRAKFKEMREALKAEGWETEREESGEGVDVIWSNIKQRLNGLIEQYAPLQKSKRRVEPLWMKGEIKKSIESKRKAWRRWKETRRELDRVRYKMLETAVKKQIRNAKNSWERKVVECRKTNPKLYYSQLSRTRTMRSKVAPLIGPDRVVVVEPKQQAELLNTYYVSVFTKSSGELPEAEDVNEAILPLDSILITEEKTGMAIDALREDSAAGPDGIPPLMLRELKQQLVKPLTLLFRRSIKTGKIPDDWRESNVTPIYKQKGSKADPGNYRPVSLTNVTCKTMERIVKNEIVQHVEGQQLMANSQHGFRSGRSVQTNMIEFMNVTTKWLDEGRSFDVLYLDFAKAFDKVCHRRLLLKLKQLGVAGDLLAWLEDWMRGRRQRVRVEGELSNWEEVVSGVLQGSVLGGVLFNIFIDDIDDAVGDAFVRKFADDTKVARIVETQSDGEIMQETIVKLEQWAAKWGMAFNASKCKVLHCGRRNPRHQYVMNRVEIGTTTEERDLGIWVTDTMKPSHQCAAAAKAANGALGLLLRSFHFRRKSNLVPLFKSFVRPRLEFGAGAWSPWTETDKKTLERVQERLIRSISDVRGASYEEKLADVGLTTLEERRKRGDLIEAFKTLAGINRVDAADWFRLIGEEARPTRANTYVGEEGEVRRERVMEVERADLEVRRNFFIVRVAKEWNLLPDRIKLQKSVNAFKNAYDAWKRKENVKNNNNVSCAISEAAEEVGLEQN